MADRKLATIRQIEKITEIEGADNIELAHIDGWKVVVLKNSFKEGDLCVYYEIDCYLPIENRYEFLRPSSYKKLDEIIGRRNEGFRLRTIKLRGQISQGLALPLSEFPEIQNPFINMDVTDLLNIEKYEPPVPACLNGQVDGFFPGDIPKTDAERIQNHKEYFEKLKDMEFDETEKIDGTSMTVVWRNTSQGVKFEVYGKTLKYLFTDTNSYWKVTKELNLENALNLFERNVAIQGELSGEGIQKNRLKLKGQHFFVFNIWNIDEGRYFTQEEKEKAITFLKQYCDIEHVPVIEKCVKVFDVYKNMDDLLKHADGPSLLNSKIRREGVVFKSLSINNSVYNQTIFKVINDNYLLEFKE